MQRRASLRAWERRSRKGDQPRLQQAKLPGQRLATPVQNHGEAFRAIAAFEPPLEDDRGWALDACGSARIPTTADRRRVLPVYVRRDREEISAYDAVPVSEKRRPDIGGNCDDLRCM